MTKDVLPRKAEEMVKGRTRLKRWHKIVTALACVVVFCTTYALILPAITMTKTPYCGLEEHEHSESCYETPLLCAMEEGHIHTGECYALQEVYVCGQEETDGHVHSADCWAEQSCYVCGQAEDAGHTHGAGCWQTVETLSCGQPETDGHTHTDACYTQERTLSCSEDHEHTDGCYTVHSALSCGQAEAPAHHHDSACYTSREELVCGQTEREGHAHTEACMGTERVLVCGLDEIPAHHHTDECISEELALVCGMEEDHEHTDACYGEPELVCTLEEHEHTDACYSDPTADVESAAAWEASVRRIERTGDWAADVIAIAKSQLGYTESTRNFILDESGTRKGYTRYGAWYGIPYGDWCAMFVSFCLHYADVPAAALPRDSACRPWIASLTELGFYHPAGSGYEPQAGDVVFFDVDGCGQADHVGLAVDVSDGTLTTIEGNSGNCVAYHTYDLNSGEIFGYASLAAVRDAWYGGDSGDTVLYYEDDELEAELRIGGDTELPEDVRLSVKRVSDGDEDGVYASMSAALGAVLSGDETACGLYRVRLSDGEDTFLLPEDADAQLQIRFRGSPFDEELLSAAHEIRGYALTENYILTPAENLSGGTLPEELPLGGLDGVVICSGRMAAVSAAADTEHTLTAAKPVSDENGTNYRLASFFAAQELAEAVGGADEALRFQMTGAGDFALALRSASDPADETSAEDGAYDGWLPAEALEAGRSYILLSDAGALNAEAALDGTLEQAQADEASQWAAVDTGEGLALVNLATGGILSVETAEEEPEALRFAAGEGEEAWAMALTEGKLSAARGEETLYYADGGAASALPEQALAFAAYMNTAEEPDYITMDDAGTPVNAQTSAVTVDYNKQIDYLGDGGANPDTAVTGESWYRLYLDVAAKAETGTDLLIVVDVSGSMNNNGGLSAVKSFLNGSDGFIQSFLASNSSNRISIVTFSGGSQVQNSPVSGVPYTSDVKSVVDWTNTAVTFSATATGGTNYAAGLFQASAQFAKLNSDGNDRVMLFLSDGAPTFAHKQYEDTRYGNGTTTDSSTKTYTNAAIDAFHTANPDVKIYSVAFGSNFTTEYLDRLDDGVSNGSCYTANNSADLKSIVGTMLYPSQVVITDTLSPYAQWGGRKANPKVTMSDGESTIVLYQNGAVTAAGSGILQSLEYPSVSTEGGGTVKLTFVPGYSLDPNYTYTLSYNVQNTKAAYDEYQNQSKGYNAEGEVNTDYGTNATSSEKPGFPSNSGATLSYTLGDTAETKDYPHPVLQANAEPEDDGGGIVPPDEPTATVENHKTIDYLGDGVENPDTDVTGETWYRLYLDAAAKSDQGVDLLLVIDVSNSMNDNGGLAAIKDFLNGTDGFISGFLSNRNNHLSIVTFSGSNQTQQSGSNYGLYTKDSKVVSGWDTESTYTFSAEPTGGTNYTAGLFAAIEQFKSAAIANDGNAKVMMFLSDGLPTFAHESTTSTIIYGTGGSDNIPAAVGTYTNNAITLFKESAPDVRVYSVAYGSSFSTTYLSSLASDGKTLKASNEDDLKNIIAGIVYPDNLVITDQLSEYVQWGGNRADLKVTMTPVSGAAVTLYENGEITSAGENILESVSYTPSDSDESTGTVTAVFKKEYTLEPNYTYTLSFNVQNTQKAYDEYRDEGYNAEGDAKTDYGTNATSSEKPGFRSNRLASVSYSVNGKPDSKLYDHPVVQANDRPDPPVPGENDDRVVVNVEKKWADTEHPASVTIRLFADGEDTGRALTLSKENAWKGSFSGLLRYRLDASGTPVTDENGDPIEIVYTVSEDYVPGYTPAQEITSSESQHTITSLAWAKADTASSGGTYLLVSERGALSAVSGGSQLQWIDPKEAEENTLAQWTYDGNGWKNGADYLMLYVSSDNWNATRRFQLGSGSEKAKFGDEKISAWSSSGGWPLTYYFEGIDDGYGVASTVSQSALSFQIYTQKEVTSTITTVTYTAVITNTKDAELPEEPKPSFTNRKTIDWLGDGAENPDTSVSGRELYRLYLDISANAQPSDLLLLVDNEADEWVKEYLDTLTKDFQTYNGDNTVRRIDFTDYTEALEAAEEYMCALGTEHAQHGKIILTVGKQAPDNKTAALAAVNSLRAVLYNSQYTPTSTAGLGLTRMYALRLTDGENAVLDALASAQGGRAEAPSEETIAGMVDNMLWPNGVVITDELSQWVDYYSRNPDLLVTRTKRDGGQTEILYSYSADYGEYKNADVIESAAYTPSAVPVDPDSGALQTSGTVTVRFKESYCLDPAYVYTLSFNVRSSRLAGQALAESETGDYPHTGDAATDYGQNVTSAGKPGFYSNHQAAVRYKLRGYGYELEYDKPVVQTRSAAYELPHSGGTGPERLMWAGLATLVFGTALSLLLRRRRRPDAG